MSGQQRPIIAGKYAIEWEIDAGAMGRVFAATQLGLDRAVAIKIMSESSADFRRRFGMEALSLARLNHRNVVTIFDTGETSDGLVFIVMEYLRGRTLADAIKRERRIEPLRALQIAAQVTRGLRAAHRQGIVHRDLKPSNVFLVEDDDEGETAKIFDFGIAKTQPGWSGYVQTRAGLVLGTPAYMAPEQVEGGFVDARADLYALGVVLYQMLTGRTPFVESSQMQLLLAQLHKRPPPPSTMVATIPPVVEAVIMRLLRKMPAERFADADALLAALNEAMVAIGGDAYRAQSTDVFGGSGPFALLPPAGTLHEEPTILAPPLSETDQLTMRDAAATLPPLEPLPRTWSPSPRTPLSLPNVTKQNVEVPIVLGELEPLDAPRMFSVAHGSIIFVLGMILAAAVLIMSYVECGAPPPKPQTPPPPTMTTPTTPTITAPRPDKVRSLPAAKRRVTR